MDMPQQSKPISPLKQLLFILRQRLSFVLLVSVVVAAAAAIVGPVATPACGSGPSAVHQAAPTPPSTTSPYCPSLARRLDSLPPSPAAAPSLQLRPPRLRPLHRPASTSGPVAPKHPAAPAPSPAPAAALPLPHQNKENKDFLQFRKCGPDNLEEMSIMYENINVTGESSMMPSCEHEVLDLEEDEIEENELYPTQAKKAKKGPVKIDDQHKWQP
ncbi:hypothetical protein ZWY2020_009906 [Hordeum vulgare]|nr:hypothetical protein ZWY2020_009906 [Hordeum vulgare]